MLIPMRVSVTTIAATRGSLIGQSTGHKAQRDFEIVLEHPKKIN